MWSLWRRYAYCCVVCTASKRRQTILKPSDVPVYSLETCRRHVGNLLVNVNYSLPTNAAANQCTHVVPMCSIELCRPHVGNLHRITISTFLVVVCKHMFQQRVVNSCVLELLRQRVAVVLSAIVMCWLVMGSKPISRNNSNDANVMGRVPYHFVQPDDCKFHIMGSSCVDLL